MCYNHFMDIILNFSKNGNNISLPATLVRSKRKTVGISVQPGGEIIIRAPRLLPQTAVLYIKKILSDFDVRISKVANGIPVGADMDYIDTSELITTS